VVVDTDRWRPGPPVLERRVPLVVHAPSTPWLKGTEQVQAVLQPLADAGRIEFRLVTGMRPAQAAELIRSADVVVDQVLLGLYGVLACEAMSAGRLVLGNVGERLRSRVPAEVPVIEVTPADLGEVLERFLSDPGAAREVAARGPAFVAQFHDGRYSSEVLAEFLTPRESSPARSFAPPSGVPAA
jgi:glycosyltransferase involved in cell wall biosynthesis